MNHLQNSYSLSRFFQQLRFVAWHGTANKKRTGEVEEYYPERDMSETIQMMLGILATHQVLIYIIRVYLVLSETYLNIRTKNAFKVKA